jgi:hypothetical protein
MCTCGTGASASGKSRSRRRVADRRAERARRGGIRRAALAAVLLLVASRAVAGATVAGGMVVGGPWWAGGAAYPWIAPPGACLAYGGCAGWAWGDRRPFRRPVAPDPPTFDDHNLWGAGGSPWGYVRRLPPPTPESQIQPQFRDASTVRPEFDVR